MRPAYRGPIPETVALCTLLRHRDNASVVEPRAGHAPAAPDLDATAVPSAIVDTADRKVVKALNVDIVTDANKVGVGRENLLAAVQASVALDPDSVGFWALPSGSGAGRPGLP